MLLIADAGNYYHVAVLLRDLQYSRLFQIARRRLSVCLSVVRLSVDDHQFGSLKRRSTTHALVDMLHHWHKSLDDGQSMRVLFVDCAKAFDHADHNVLL